MKRFETKDYFKDVFQETGIRIVKTENGLYKWVIDSKTEFRTPVQALLDAQAVIGQPDRDEMMIFDEPEIPWTRTTVSVNVDVDWAPIIPLR